MTFIRYCAQHLYKRSAYFIHCNPELTIYLYLNSLEYRIVVRRYIQNYQMLMLQFDLFREISTDFTNVILRKILFMQLTNERHFDYRTEFFVLGGSRCFTLKYITRDTILLRAFSFQFIISNLYKHNKNVS